MISETVAQHYRKSLQISWMACNSFQSWFCDEAHFITQVYFTVFLWQTQNAPLFLLIERRSKNYVVKLIR